VTIIFVPIFKRLKLGSVLGYLGAGIIVGPYGLKLISGEGNIFHLAELGLVFLLFLIGQELTPKRLSTLKTKIVFDGGAQFVFTTLIFCFPVYYFTQSWKSSLVVSMALSLSSTAFVLSYLKDTKQLTLSYGQLSFSILLFQDIIIVPILTLLPFLNGADAITHLTFSYFAKSLSILVGTFLFLKYCLRPLLSFVRKESSEVFTAFCLLVIIGMAFAMENVGLSKALGAFLAGIFLSEYEFKKEVESVILPFKGMLMGVFFMTFGLQFNLNFFSRELMSVVGICAGLVVGKFLIFYAIGIFRMPADSAKAKRLSLLMSQGGEFGLIVIAMSLQQGIFSQSTHDYLMSAIILSLVISPVLSKVAEKVKLNDENVKLSESKDEDNLIEFPKDKASETKVSKQEVSDDMAS
jgi:monovalent cation:proton antiporter-2 (CPA2) family protein